MLLSTEDSSVIRRRRKYLELSQQVLQRAKNRRDSLGYLKKRLGIRPETIDWNLIPAYKDHKWDGTPNPLKEIIDAVDRWEWCGVESANGVGKTFIGAAIALRFLETYVGGAVILSAPKQDQLTLHIWKEVNRLFPLFDMGELMTEKLKMDPTVAGWELVLFVAGTKREEVETSASKARGFHAEHMLFILEETNGIAQSVINAFEDTSAAPHNLILAFGNPDHQLDSLHKFCSLPRVKHIRISAYDHPNVVLGDPSFIAGAITLKGIHEKIERYGSGSVLEQSRNRGICPSQSWDSLIRLDWCIEAASRKPTDPNIEKAIGVDVANSADGDRASIAIGRGRTLLKVESFQCPNANELGHQVARRIKDEAIKYIAVDGIGVGVATVNVMRDDHKLRLDDLTGGVKEYMGKVEEFNSLRSQMYWTMREDLQNGRLVLPDDPELFQDLTTPKWSTKAGKICVQSKEEIKKKLGRSPDKGDAAIYWNWARHTNERQTKAPNEDEKPRIQRGDTATRTKGY